MKTNLPRSLFLTGLAIGALTLLAPNVTWADGKGASQLMFGPATQTTAQVTPAKAAMACPRCKDVYKRVADTSAKGTRSESMKTVAAHGCPTCATKITSSGAGKAKADKVVHSCGMDSSCCVVTK